MSTSPENIVHNNHVKAMIYNPQSQGNLFYLHFAQGY